MMRSLWTAASGMVAQQANIDVVSNNLANVNTTGFKKSRSDFEDLMYQTIRQSGTATGADTMLPTGIQLGSGVRQVATQKIYTQGPTQSTGNDLDMTIEGDGFFQITMADGTINYTRDGAFKRDDQGRIVTSEGYPLEPAITIPENSSNLAVSSDGRVSVILAGETEAQELGQLQLVKFVNPAGLDSVGHNLLKETAASGTPVASDPGVDGTGKIMQKYLEMSNVQVVEEMVNMIVAQRAYEINSKAITTSDNMLEQVANLKR
jgi:flagellar basal-body rod protein FlgG